jgi:hypothetical protein
MGHHSRPLRREMDTMLASTVLEAPERELDDDEEFDADELDVEFDEEDIESEDDEDF